MTFNLTMGEFEKNLVRTCLEPGGVRYVFRFENGYGASVIKYPGSYGYTMDLWELGVLVRDGSGLYQLTYDTDISSDVEGFLTDEGVRELLGRIRDL